MCPFLKIEVTPVGWTVWEWDRERVWLDSFVSRVKYCFTWCRWLCWIWYLDWFSKCVCTWKEIERTAKVSSICQCDVLENFKTVESVLISLDRIIIICFKSFFFFLFFNFVLLHISFLCAIFPKCIRIDPLNNYQIIEEDNSDVTGKEHQVQLSDHKQPWEKMRSVLHILLFPCKIGLCWNLWSLQSNLQAYMHTLNLLSQRNYTFVLKQQKNI